LLPRSAYRLELLDILCAGDDGRSTRKPSEDVDAVSVSSLLRDPPAELYALEMAVRWRYAAAAVTGAGGA